MPYRRLPNTDQARIRALKAAVEKGETDQPMQDRVIPLQTLIEARNFLTKFEAAQIFYTQCYEIQARGGKKHQKDTQMARLYISHFIQVLNFSILRKEIKEEHRLFYGLSVPNVVPDLLSDSAISEWGKKLIEGEHLRLAHGGTPIYNPTIARVKMHYDRFCESYTQQKNYQTATNRSLEELSSMRKRADELILDIWNRVEEKFSVIPIPKERLALCREYGVIYYYRSGEKREQDED